jgi:uncharacterized membrane protein YkvA (DUF1232 family)
MMRPAFLHRLRIDAHAAWLAARDSRTPLAARSIGWLVAAYALSPIDLIPDFIPVLGLLDDLILVPLGLWLFRRLIPDPLFEEFRRQAELESTRPISRAGILIVILAWIAILACLTFYVWSWRYW